MGVYACLYIFEDKTFYKEVVPLLKEESQTIFLQSYIDTYFSHQNLSASSIQEKSKDLDEDFKNIENHKKQNKDSDYENYCSLLEHLVVSKCLPDRPTLRIGKYSLKYRFLDNTKEFEWQPDSFAFEMLKKLDGTTYWTHSSGGYHEGIRGWIDHEEAALMLEDLDSVAFNSEYQKFYEDEEKALREFLEQAVSLGKGILNGGDLRFFENRF